MQAALLLLSTVALTEGVFTHGWGSVSEQIAGNFGTWNPQFNNSDTFQWIATHYAAIAMNDWFQRGQSSQMQVARALKSYNPKLKLLWCGPATCAPQQSLLSLIIFTFALWF